MELKFKIKLSDDFMEEIDDICNFLNYISKSNILSERLILKVYQNMEILSNAPEICPKIKGKYRYNREYRKMIIGHYVLLYGIDYYDEKIIYIAHIYDGRSNYLKSLV